VWYLSVVLASLMVFTALRFKGKRKRMLASQIPGLDGLFLVGLLPLLLDGPEKIIKHGIKLYRM